MWGCLAKVGIPEPKRKKIGPKTVDAVFIGYSLDSNTYRFLVINSEISEILNNTLIESRDATFFENIFPFKNQTNHEVSNYNQSVDTSKLIDTISATSSIHNCNDTHDLQEIRRSKRMRIQKKHRK